MYFINFYNYEFELLGKITTNYTHVQIRSTDIYSGEEKIFWVYPSNSELGLWRLVARQNNLFYKGNRGLADAEMTMPEEERFYYDYVQQTFIHINLQVFLNNNVDKLPDLVLIDVESYFPTLPPHVKEGILVPEDETMDVFHIIDDKSRQVKMIPFIILQNQIECGEICTKTPRMRKPAQAIQEFSKNLERIYTLGNVVKIEEYSKSFKNLIQIDGSILLFPLINKETGEVVNLYAIVAHLSQTSETFGICQENIERICQKDIHIMPFLLTLPSSTINKYGLYSHYIPCGAFICKLFDYSSGLTTPGRGYIQCTEEEFKNGCCDSVYSYIGDRYENIFPFNLWYSQLGGKPRTKSKPKSKPKSTRRHSY